MADPASHHRNGGDADGGSPPRMPRWVKAAAIVVGVLIAIFLVLQVTGIAGEHGPGRHFSGSGEPLEKVTGEPAAPVTGVR